MNEETTNNEKKQEFRKSTGSFFKKIEQIWTKEQPELKEAKEIKIDEEVFSIIDKTKKKEVK